MKTLEEINQRLEEIREMMDDTEKRGDAKFSDLEKEVRELKEQKEELEARARTMKETEDLNSGKAEGRKIETFNGGGEPEHRHQEPTEEEQWEQRGNDLYENRSITVSSDDLVLPKHDSATIKDTFNQVSSLIDRVTVVPLNGGESYVSPFDVQHGEGNYTEEGENYFEIDQEFGYAEINKTKITSYKEITEEVLKLPRANYGERVVNAVRQALRKKITKEILVGDGSNGHFVGIFSNQATAINPATDIEISEINKDTLDDLIYAFGGDEDVEDESVLILSKSDLRRFAQVRDEVGRKYYDIVNNGNTGSINGVSFVINSGAGSLTSSDDGAYLMAYGPLSNYEMGVFSPVVVQRFNDFKFRQGMVAHRGDVFSGGNVVAHNGFLRVKKGADSGEPEEA